jgi:hypothetical protein
MAGRSEIGRIPRLGRIARVGIGAWVAMLAAVAPAHAHGGMASPSELGPPLLTSGAIGLACYWLVMLWPSAKAKRRHQSGPRGGKSSGKTRDTSVGVAAGGPKKIRARRPKIKRGKPQLKMVATTRDRERAGSERNAADV